MVASSKTPANGMTTTKTIFSCMRQPQALRHCFFQQVAGQQILRVSRCVPFLVAAIAAASSSETGDDTSISEPIQIRHLTCLPPFSTVIVAGGEPDCNLNPEVAWQAARTPPLGELEEVDMRGKRVLITGATSGLGLMQAKARAR